MLPYRRRPPVYGGKLTARKQQEADAKRNTSNDNADHSPRDADPLHGGGPVQRAIELDLLALRAQFLQLLQQQQEDAAATESTNDTAQLLEGVNPLSRHQTSEGKIFGAFKTAFGAAKVALLHSRTIPPRCDRDSYSQLIYAACLSLLKKSFEEASFCLEHAAFAVFCLYTLFRINPLPTVPPIDAPTTINISQQERNRQILSMLPMGLQSLENPKSLYRRSFRSLIRIDRYHYSLLLRLLEECRARQAECQAKNLSSLLNRDVDHPKFHCNCGIATDAIIIVRRVVESLELVEYTGPCGVEGLAGHADYPFSSVMPTDATTDRAPNGSAETRLDEIHAPTSATRTDSYELNNSFMQTLSEYRDKFQSLSLPASTSKIASSNSHVRSALEPIFDAKLPSWTDLCDEISKQSSGCVVPSTSLHTNTTTLRVQRKLHYSELNTATGHNSSKAGAGDARKTVWTYVVLPPGLSAPTREGIASAVEMILTRYPTAWRGNATVSAGQSQVPTATIRHDDLSTVDDGVSTLSQATGPGRAALRSLLAEVAKGVDSAKTLQPTDQFLLSNMEEDGMDRLAWKQSSGDDEASANESGDDNDNVSVAVSTVGRRALHMLLSKVDQTAVAGNANNGPSFSKKDSIRDTNKEKKRARAHSTRSKKSHRGCNSSVEEVEQERSPSGDAGRAALQALLSRVANHDNESSGSENLRC